MGLFFARHRKQKPFGSLRYITNTTRTPRRGMLDKLARIGLRADADELFMPAIAARHYLERHRLAPLLLVHPARASTFIRMSPGAVGYLFGFMSS